jgi:hypothetical protein
MRGFPDRSSVNEASQNKTLEDILATQKMAMTPPQRELISTILSCLPQVCRGVPTRVHWIYPSPGTGETVLVYLKLIPIANETLESFQLLLISYEIDLPPHLPVDPPPEPSVQPKIPSFFVHQPSVESPTNEQKENGSNEWDMILNLNPGNQSSVVGLQTPSEDSKVLVPRLI